MEEENIVLVPNEIIQDEWDNHVGDSISF